MAKYRELENVLKRYIDSPAGGRGEGRGILRELLKTESVDTRHGLLMNVRGTAYITLTALHEAAGANDLESIRLMLDGFPSDKKYDLLKIQSDGYTPLQTAATCGHSSIITYLMTDLSQQQKHDVLKIQDMCGDTALHDAASQNKIETYRAILASVPYHLLLELGKIKNNAGKTVTDIKPEIKDEYIVPIAEGKQI